MIDAYLFDDADENENDLKVQEFIKKHIGGIRTGRNALKRRELRLTLPKLSLETEVNLVNQMQVSSKWLDFLESTNHSSEEKPITKKLPTKYGSMKNGFKNGR